MYTLSSFGTIIRVSDGAFIPSDIANLDYVEYLAWCASGHVAVDPLTLLTLEQAQAQQIGQLTGSYQSAIAQPVSFNSHGGVTKTYQADAQSIANLQAMLAAFGSTQTAPAGFYWVASDNTHVAFTYADMQGLAEAMGAQVWAAFQRLQTQKASVLAAVTPASALSVQW